MFVHPTYKSLPSAFTLIEAPLKNAREWKKSSSLGYLAGVAVFPLSVLGAPFTAILDTIIALFEGAYVYFKNGANPSNLLLKKIVVFPLQQLSYALIAGLLGYAPLRLIEISLAFSPIATVIVVILASPKLIKLPMFAYTIGQMTASLVTSKMSNSLFCEEKIFINNGTQIKEFYNYLKLHTFYDQEVSRAKKGMPELKNLIGTYKSETHNEIFLKLYNWLSSPTPTPDKLYEDLAHIDHANRQLKLVTHPDKTTGLSNNAKEAMTNLHSCIEAAYNYLKRPSLSQIFF